MGADYLDQATPFDTPRDAVDSFAETARELNRYGQRIEASVHIASNSRELVEDPDYLLSLGPRGGLRCERY